jgi:NAD(P)-dependent dehydrogenase (short-subunit alcohol dehydrogenase family)
MFANAGIGTGGGMLHELDLATWNRVMAVNLGGIFLCCKYALRSMVESGQGGSIVCTSSPTAFAALAAGGVPAYSSSKGGISSLVRCLAVDYARYGIRVNAIAPGATETKLMWDNVPPEEIPRVRETVHQEVPLGRLAQPEEIAQAAIWLLSDESSYVTGSHLICDGGILAKASISV